MRAGFSALSGPRGVTRPLWAEIHLGHIGANVRTLLGLNDGRALMAVVKANGYGHGAVRVAESALAAGASWLGVATPKEGSELRRAGITAPILVLGAFYPGQERVFATHQLTATVAGPEALKALTALPDTVSRFPVHLKVDTGMGRLGFLPGDAVGAATALRAGGVEVQGVYTHLATADAEDTAFALEQLQRFRTVLSQLADAGLRPVWCHASNSAAVMQLPLDMVNLTRAGIALYGLPPSSWLAGRVPLLPAMSLHARVVAARRLPAGSPVSYGSTYVTGRETTIVALPVGYADGYTRRLSHKAHVLIAGHRFPVVGTICMDQCLVDVGDYPARVGEEAVLIGRQGEAVITADDLADATDTINYEIICGISGRVPRVYRAGDV